MEPIFDKVLFIGPDIKAQGGIASVLRSYSQSVSPFHYLRSNSAKGTVCGLFALFFALLRLPYFKWFKSIRILHIHAASGKSFVRKTIIVNWARLLGYKIVFHSHSGYFKDYVNRRGKTKIKKVLDKCDVVVALSKVWKDYFEQELGYNNVFVVNNIVHRAADLDLSTANAPHDKLKLLFLGLICDNKGVFDLLDVFASHKDSFEDKVELLIGGVGEDDRMNAFISENQLGGMVKPLGWVTGKRKEELMRDCDVCILPSYIEGVPISILEAMAHAKAVIASNVGGIPEIVTDGVSGVLHRPGDKDAIYRAIKLFLEDPLSVKTFGKAGYKNVTSFYPGAVVSQLEQMYIEMLSVTASIK